MKTENIEKAKKLITDYLLDEFYTDTDFDDLDDIGLAYSDFDFWTNEEHFGDYSAEDCEAGTEVQVSISLLRNVLVQYIPNEDVAIYYHFSSDDELLKWLEWLDFDCLYSDAIHSLEPLLRNKRLLESEVKVNA